MAGQGAYDANWRINSSRVLAVNSGGGATVSTTSVGSQTRAVDLCFVTVVVSTAATGVRFAISDMQADSITSQTGGLLPPNQIVRYAITPGQKIQAVSADTAVPLLTILELCK